MPGISRSGKPAGNCLFPVSEDDALWGQVAYGEKDASAGMYFSVRS